MSIVSTNQWKLLKRWSPKAFAIGGVGSLSVVAISVLEMTIYGQRFQLVPEWGIAMIALPTFLATFLGLFGFYPYISDQAPRLSRVGAFAAGFGGVLLVVNVVASITLDLLGIVSFTGGEENPALLIGFMLLFVALFGSLLFYGIASVLTKTPSRTVGLLLLVTLVEPIFTLLFDVVVNIEIPGGPLGTLAVEGLALVLIGYLLWSGTEPTPGPEPTPDPGA